MNQIASKTRRGRKFDQVLEGARKVFMSDGFEGASVDAIAKQAGVSKATLYSYFSDKRRLFFEVARMECLRQADFAFASIDQTDPARTVLRAAAEHIIGFILSDFAQSVYRVFVAEADRFPELAREFYNSGPRIAKDALGPFLELAMQRGELNIPDIDLAAFQFSALCKAEIFDKRIFRVRDSFSQSEINHVIDSAVDMFMARYGVDAS